MWMMEKGLYIRPPHGRETDHACQKERLQAHAEAHGESVNGFINRAISETLERETRSNGQQEADA